MYPVNAYQQHFVQDGNPKALPCVSLGQPGEIQGLDDLDWVISINPSESQFAKSPKVILGASRVVVYMFTTTLPSPFEVRCGEAYSSVLQRCRTPMKHSMKLRISLKIWNIAEFIVFTLHVDFNPLRR